ncbi:MAG: ERAP1-like C-terminal domain-containing protein, partial [Deltaproteobacteria bacterium]|nr:ERAP1-like C-terminal domain-containing protein [Deltaproteobacteria bacterium]
EREGRHIVLSQRVFRYLQDGTDQEPRWHVPIFVRAGTKSGVLQKTLLLTEGEQRVELPDTEWVAVNAGGHGYYRVRYSADLIGALKQGLQTHLSAVERFGLVSDSWAATLAGLTPLADYIALLELFRDERDLNVWNAMILSSYQLIRILDEVQRVALQKRIQPLFNSAVERLTWSAQAGESDLQKQLRGELINALGVACEDRPCQKRAYELYADYENNPAAIERNLVPALVSIIAHTGGAGEFDKFCGKFKNAKTPQEETRYLFALAAFRRPELIEKTLNMTINGEVRTQNAPYLMRGVLLNRDARDKAWSFMKSHWGEMTRLYPDNSIPRMCEGIIGLVTPELEADVKDFFAKHLVKQGTKQMEQHLERLRIAVASQQRWRAAPGF